MQVFGGTWAVWVVWGMLLTGTALVLASLRHTSERFWYWKQARQMAAGEIAPAGETLRVDQHLRVLSVANKGDNCASFLSDSAVDCSDLGAAAILGKITGIQRGRLQLRLEPETLTREDEQAWANFAPVQVGQTLTVQITGDSELFRFTAVVRRVRSDPQQPYSTYAEVESPFWLNRIQRRQHVRAPLHSGVTLQTVDENDKNSNVSETLRGTLRDLSGGGLCLELDNALRPDTIARLCEQWGEGAVLECRLNLPLLRETPLCLRIHACERVAARGGLSLRLRGEFTQVPAWIQETLVSVVFQAQRQQFRQPSPQLQTAV